MMFSKTNKKLLLMLSIFLCLACVVGCVSAADVDDAVIVDSDSNNVGPADVDIDDVNNNIVTDDSDSDSIVIDDAVAYIPFISIPLNDTETIAIDVDGNVVNNDSSIDYKHLPVGTEVTIKIPQYFTYKWEIKDYYGVELIKNYTICDSSCLIGYAQVFVFKVVGEDYNILLTKDSDLIVHGFRLVAKYNFTDNPFEHNAQVIVKKPANTCLACSNVPAALIGSDVIQMNSLSVLDDVVSVDSDSNSVVADGADIPIIPPLNDIETIVIEDNGSVIFPSDYHPPLDGNYSISSVDSNGYFTITTRGNPTTGHDWFFDEANSHGVTLVDTIYYPDYPYNPPMPMIIGSGGIYVFTFHVDNLDDYFAQIIYKCFNGEVTDTINTNMDQ